MTIPIYVVMGTTGEYSDRSQWPVKAYRTEASARVLVEKASERAREIEVATKGSYRAMREAVNEHDPHMDMDYTGTTYYVMKVDLA